MDNKNRVKVVVRVWPTRNSQNIFTTDSEHKALDSTPPILEILPFTNQIIVSKCDTAKPFVFDHVFDQKVTQKDVYNKFGPELLSRALSGHNTCLFVYGQKGSGKDYTLFGNSKERGFISDLCEELFEHVAEKSENLDDPDEQEIITTHASYMEIHNEKVYDLMASDKIPLKVREHSSRGVYVDGLSHNSVTSSEEIQNIINEGQKHKVDVTSKYSRSHTILTIILTKIAPETLAGKSSSKDQVSKISFVDLAPIPLQAEEGKTKANFREDAPNINKSLFTLGFILSKVAEGKSNTFFPIRDSVLTWILKDTLCGNGRMTMIATVSNSSKDCEETLSTLRYAERSKKIDNNPVLKRNNSLRKIKELKTEVAQLIRQLARRDNAKEELAKPVDSNSTPKEKSPPLNDLGGVSKNSEDVTGIQGKENRFYLFNLNKNPSPEELVVYNLSKDKTVVGRPTTLNPPDIQLSGCEDIKKLHCEFTVESDGFLYLIPYLDANTSVNGERIFTHRKLRHGDNVLLGGHYAFRVHTPKKIRYTSLPVIVESYGYVYKDTEDIVL